ncbi:MAG TPA: S9 family peptidase [Terriglobales bacterium]|nr:S9 family peptidase [Terriglobales bacterium]
MAIFLLFLLASWATCSTQTAETPRIDPLLRQIFLDNDFRAQFPPHIEWLPDGNSYTVLENSPANPKAKDIVRYQAGTGARDVLVNSAQITAPSAKEPLAIDDYAFSPDLNRVLIFTNAQRVWRAATRGDYWLLDRRSGKLLKLGGNAGPAELMFAKFSPDGQKVAYVRANNVYVEQPETGEIMQLTTDGSATIINGTTDWVYEEEFFLRDAFLWSPDSKKIAFWQFDISGVLDFTLIYDTGGPHHIVTGIPYPQFGVYPTTQEIPYPQPGTTNSAVRIGVVNATGGAPFWMQVPGDPRNNYIPRAEWTEDSRQLAIQHVNRLQNENTVLLADAQTGQVHPVFTDTDKAWVDVNYEFQWIKVDRGSEFLWTSERDGWRHAYAIATDGRQRLLTPGNYDIIRVEGVDSNSQWLYFTASPKNATQQYLYRVPITGNAQPQEISPANQAGTHTYEISPNGLWAVHTYSTFDTPPVTDLVSLPAHRSIRVLQDNATLRAKLTDLLGNRSEFFQVDIGGGVTLDGWMIKPKDFDPAKKYPLLINIYGEPAAQTVVDRWPGAGGLFHRALASEGYLVASFDNRGTPAPKGREWRKIVYGSVGVLSSKDQAEALMAVERSRPYIDANRVAIWGWSGGGSNTLNMMFRSPELYKVGMAVAPVADQRLYDTIYQERYMGLPQDNPEGYRAGSAINFADGLRGDLLIVHGSGDDNVHFQGTELLVNRLIELGKQFDFMDYPGRTHSISEGKGTTFHVYSLLARYLEEHLPVSGAASAQAGN